MDSVTTSHLKLQAKMSNRGAYDKPSVSVYKSDCLYLTRNTFICDLVPFVSNFNIATPPQSGGHNLNFSLYFIYGWLVVWMGDKNTIL